MKKHALKYLEMGFNVMPVGTNKRPLLSTWVNYQTEMVSKSMIDKWWDTWPGANIAIITGETSNLLVVDADSEQGLLELKNIGLTNPTVKTPKGWHYYFEHNDGFGNAARFLPDCDIRGQGGYIVAPPSRNGSGNQYYAIDEAIDRQAMPQALHTIIYNFFYNSVSNKVDVADRLRDVTNGYIDFTKGKRDESLFHVANCLIKGGMNSVDVEKCLRNLAVTCDPPFPEKDIQSKVNSAVKRSDSKNRNVSQEIKDLILLQTGNIRVSDCYTQLHAVTKQEKTAIRVAIRRLVKDDLLEPTGKNIGEYRIVNEAPEPIDWKNAKENWVNLYLPWKIPDFVKIPEGGIILLMGNPGSGKTAALMNIARYNMTKKWNVHYLSTEISNGAFKNRAEKYNKPISDWNVNFYYDPPMVDTITGGLKSLWLIDYIELYESFWEVGKTLADIYRKLNGGVAVCAIQKQPGSDIALGGQFTQFKPCLTLALEWQKVKIVKARDIDEMHIEKYGSPRGKEYHFKMVENRTKYIEERWWTHPFKGE